MMKRLLFCISMLFATLTFGQSHDISINLAPMVLRNYSGNYFYNFADNMGAGGTIGYHNLKIGTATWKGYYVVPEFRFYWDPDGDNDGKYIGGYLKYRNMSTTDTETLYDQNGEAYTNEYGITASGVALGIVGGRMWASRGGFTFHSWSGLGFFLMDDVTYIDVDEPSEETNLPSFDFRLGLSIGWRIGSSGGGRGRSRGGSRGRSSSKRRRR